MNEETPSQVDRRLAAASFVLSEIRAGRDPWPDPADTGCPEGEDEPEQGTVAADYAPGGRHNP